MSTTWHAPFPPTATITAEGRKLVVLIKEPRPVARTAGEVAYESGLERWANPHAEETAEFVNWDAGWNDARQRDS